MVTTDSDLLTRGATDMTTPTRYQIISKYAVPRNDIREYSNKDDRIVATQSGYKEWSVGGCNEVMYHVRGDGV